MKKTLATMLTVTAIAAGPALADDDCFVPMAKWQPREAAASFAAAQGWSVRRIKIDDGCYEIKGRDADGREIEVKLHPDTLSVIEFEYEDDEDDDEDDDDDDDRRASPVPPTPSAPTNGLLGTGETPQVVIK
ncbi:PepSY domain-containing protein [Litoreibacter janthinus]|uniref:PepSY domain-containing protein n=1 Tax=Litoreibacter janthinus TaxID=670154 RepID=A0A1I6GDT6_9RHOB|nr:PepSY domain-containing protein [Litoreibacter janthinus]SFR40247.1 hypothetical protein SAMN04488002_1286 [Litoreibacter janthinus]